MLTSSEIMLTRYNIYIFLESKIVVATSMQKISTVALSVQKLGWGGNFYPPHPFSVHKKPIPNRVKIFFNNNIIEVGIN